MAIISVQHLSYTYAGNEMPTLQDVSFQIEQGEIVALLGPSGAGKSTTQSILTGLLKGYAGSVAVLGTEVRDVRSHYYEHIGVAFEVPHFYSKFTALENLRHFASFYPGNCLPPEEVLEQVGLLGDRDTFVASFSKGMRMRLNLCRALLHQPRLLFLDEPTSGLDPVNAERVRQLLLEQQEMGTTIVITTHNMHVADAICDRVAFIADGQLLAMDTPRSLKQQHGQKTVRIEYVLNGQLESTEFALDGIADNEAFQHLLRRHAVETMHTQEATLDDVFVQMAGRGLVES